MSPTEFKSSPTFANVSWTPLDVLTLRPSWTPEQAEEWLSTNEKYIQDRTIEAGWEIMETLLP